MKNLKIKAPAKINFGLNISEKREDGFHNIETIFYPVKLFDVLTFSSSNDLILTSNSEILNREEDNLVLKVIRALEQRINKTITIKIHLKKNIPIGAGLGGGSSDAAAVLNTMKKILKPELDNINLTEVAGSIGSDVSFFMDSVPCFAHSRGEILEQINFKIKKPILIVCPDIQISTRWAYENVRPKKTEFDLKELIKQTKSVENLKNKLKNDFEKIVFNKFPEVKEIKRKLYKLGAEFALMSGSGSSVFGIFPDTVTAETAKISFPKKYFTFIHYEN